MIVLSAADPCNGEFSTLCPAEFDSLRLAGILDLFNFIERQPVRSVYQL